MSWWMIAFIVVAAFSGGAVITAILARLAIHMAIGRGLGW